MKRRAVVVANTAILLLLTAPHGARADEKGDVLLKQAFAKLNAATTYAADITSATKIGDKADATLKGKMAAMKPNYLKLELEGDQSMTIVSDGKNLFSYAGGTPFYFKQPVPAHPTELPGSWEGEIDSFFGGASNVA